MSKPRADGEIVRLSHIVNPIGRRRLKVSGDVEIVGVVPVVPALLLVEAAEAVSDRLGRISREIALRGIKLPCNSGQCSLGLDLDLGYKCLSTPNTNFNGFGPSKPLFNHTAELGLVWRF